MPKAQTKEAGEAATEKEVAKEKEAPKEKEVAKEKEAPKEKEVTKEKEVVKATSLNFTIPGKPPYTRIRHTSNSR